MHLVLYRWWGDVSLQCWDQSYALDVTSPSESCLLLEGCQAASFLGILLSKVSAVISHPAQPGAGRQPPVHTAACGRYRGHRRAGLIRRAMEDTTCNGRPWAITARVQLFRKYCQFHAKCSGGSILACQHQVRPCSMLVRWSCGKRGLEKTARERIYFQSYPANPWLRRLWECSQARWEVERKEGKKEGFGEKLHLKTSANQGLWGSVQTTTEEDTRAVKQGWRRSQAKWWQVLFWWWWLSVRYFRRRLTLYWECLLSV